MTPAHRPLIVRYRYALDHRRKSPIHHGAVDTTFLPIDDLKILNEAACPNHSLLPTQLPRGHRPHMVLHGKQDVGGVTIKSFYTRFGKLVKHSSAPIWPDELGVARPQSRRRQCKHQCPCQTWQDCGIYKVRSRPRLENLGRQIFAPSPMEAGQAHPFDPVSAQIYIPLSHSFTARWCHLPTQTCHMLDSHLILAAWRL